MARSRSRRSIQDRQIGHERILRKLNMGTYTAAGSLANVCWSPRVNESIAENVPPHIHSFYEMVFIEKGSGRHIINGGDFLAGPGHLALMAPGSSHDPRGLQGTALWVLIFNVQALNAEGWPGAVYTADGRALGAAQLLLKRIYRNAEQCLVFRVPAVERGRIANSLDTIESENAQRAIGWEQVVGAQLNLLLVGLLRRQPTGVLEDEHPSHPIVNQAMSFIDRNFSRPVELRDIAKHVARSPAYVTTLVKRHTGLSAIAWLSDRRLWEARNLILTSRMPIKKISARLGYAGSRHFSQAFKRRFGNSPINWRKRMTE